MKLFDWHPKLASFATLADVISEIRALRAEARQRHSWLTRELEKLMALASNQAASVQALFDALTRAESAIDAQSAIVDSQTALLTDISAQLAAVVSHPVPSAEQIQSVIDGINSHVATLTTSVSKLVSADPKPADPKPVDPAPVTVVEPVAGAVAAEPVAAAPVVEPVPVAAEPVVEPVASAAPVAVAAEPVVV